MCNLSFIKKVNNNREGCKPKPTSFFGFLQQPQSSLANNILTPYLFLPLSFPWPLFDAKRERSKGNNKNKQIIWLVLFFLSLSIN